MEVLKNHIACFLLVLFTFPMLYQPFHMLEHLAEEQLEEHTFGHHHHHGEQGLVNTGDAHCLVCEYEFAVFNTPPQPGIWTEKPTVFQIISGPEERHIVLEKRSGVSLRAPPSFS